MMMRPFARRTSITGRWARALGPRTVHRTKPTACAMQRSICACAWLPILRINVSAAEWLAAAHACHAAVTSSMWQWPDL